LKNEPSILDWLKLLARFRVASLEQLQTIASLDKIDIDRWENENVLVRSDIPTLNGGMKTVLALGRKGAEEVARAGGKDISGIPYFTTARFKRSMFTIEHELGITDVGLCLHLLNEQNSTFKLLYWETTPQRIGTSVHVITRRGLETVPLVADAFFGVGVAQKSLWFLLEVDRGTIDLKRMAKKLSGYREWWQCQGPKHRFGVNNLRVLFLVPNMARLNALKNVWQTVSTKGGKGFVWFALQQTANLKHPQLFTEAVWQTLDFTDNRSLFNLVPDRRPEPGACG